MIGTNDSILGVTTDMNGNIYAGDIQGKLYRCNQGESNFQQIGAINYLIQQLSFDQVGNLYILANILDDTNEIIGAKFYQQLIETTNLLELTGIKRSSQ